MTIRKTKCRQCLYKNKIGVEEPCHHCKEIQYKIKGNENYFIENKNLMTCEIK